MEEKIKKGTEMCLSINRFSNSKPDLFDTTGSSGTSPETVKQYKERKDQQKVKLKKKRNKACKIKSIKREKERENEIYWSSSWWLKRKLGFWVFVKPWQRKTLRVYDRGASCGVEKRRK